MEKNLKAIGDLQGYFKPGERKAIYNAANEFRDKVLIRLLWVTGRRISEVIHVKVHEIDFNLNKIAFHIEKKTEKIQGVRLKKDLVRLKPVDEWTMNLIKRYISDYDLKEKDYLFPGQGNKIHLTRQRAYQIVQDSCYKAGVFKVGGKKPHPHHFRHTLCIDMVRNAKSPADIRKIQMYFEHSTLAVTEQYMQFSDEEQKDLLESLGD